MSALDKPTVIIPGWFRTDSALPPEGKLVDTRMGHGQQQRMKRGKNLWFCENEQMYVYYTPEYWKYIE